jgi:hypothetical protein
MTKSRWGIGIALGIGGFVLAIAVMVVISLSSPTDLVTDRYYERGIAYQEQIATLQRTVAREEKLAVALEDGGIRIVFPRREEVVPLSGTILLYRPSDKSRDRSVPVLPDSTGSQRISSAGLERGLWKVKVSWKEKGTEYYGEEQVMLR